jgi:hypothetical protein
MWWSTPGGVGVSGVVDGVGGIRVGGSSGEEETNEAKAAGGTQGGKEQVRAGD